MARAGGNKGMPHLFSGLIASGLAAVVLFAGRTVAGHLEHTTVPSTTPELFRLKNQGLAFQRAAVRAQNVLPLYGTSELITPSVQERASLFFRSAPTGFQVSPVGGAGANLLVMLQKVGALGSDLRGKKTRHLAFTRLVFEGQVGAEGLRGEFFADGSEQNDIRHRAEFRAETGHCFTHA
jgi:hypothetical protein